jgi:VWFA-related protein
MPDVMPGVLAVMWPIALFVWVSAASIFPTLQTATSEGPPVELRVVVQDRSGRLLTDVEPDEFELELNGRTQRIDRVAFVDMTAAHTRLSRLFFIVFDEPHLTPASLKRAQSAANALVARQFHQGDLAGVYADGQLVGDRLMTDRDAVSRAIKRAHVAPRVDDAPLLEPFRPGCDPDRPVDCAPAVDRFHANAEMADDARAAGRATAMLPALIGTLTRVVGPKAVLLLSEAPMAGGSARLLDETLEAASRADARLYVFDLGASTTANGDVDRLAGESGGFVARGAGSFDGAAEQVARDADVFYVLGFRPDGAADGKARRVTVRTRRGEATVRVRQVLDPAGAPSVALPAGAVRWEALRAAPVAVETAVPVAPPAAPDVPFNAGVVVPAATSATEAMRVRPMAARSADRVDRGGWTDTNAEAGWLAYQRGDLEAARTALAAATQRPGTLTWVRYTLGTSNYALGHFGEAAADWEIVRARHPEYGPVYFDLAAAYVQLKDRGKAIAVLRAAKARWPLDAEVYNDLGTVQAAAGLTEEAIRTFQEGTQAAPNEPTTYLNLAAALDLKYTSLRRYNAEAKRYLGNDRERDDAIRMYERYIALGGPYVDQARKAIERLKTSSR